MSATPITVIHHSADYDGLFCREIARKFLPDAKLIGWDYGDPLIQVPDGQIYILDLAPNCFEMLREETMRERVIWIDHHKSAIEFFPKNIPGYRIDGVAACRLAWQWFTKREALFHPTGGSFAVPLPTDVQFKNREVSEPLAVRLAGEYDVWDRLEESHFAFQFGLDCQEQLDWISMLGLSTTSSNATRGETAEDYVWKIVQDGRAAMRCYAKRDADVVHSRSFLTDFEGLKFLCLNTARCNSQTFAARDMPTTGHDALLAFFWSGKDFTVSMYHAAHRKDLDLSEIAKRFGGGGHRGACGFRVKSLPFVG